MTKPKKDRSNREMYRRLIEDTNFQEKLTKFRAEVGLPKDGIDEPAVYDAWIKQPANKQSIDAFSTEILSDEQYDGFRRFLNRVLEFIVPMQGCNFEVLFDLMMPDCELIDGAEIMDKDLRSKLKNSSIIIIGPNANKSDIGNFVSEKDTWWKIQDIRKTKGQNPSGRKIQPRRQAEKHKLLLQMRQDGFLKADGDIKNTDSMPKRYQQLIEEFSDKDTRKDILWQEQRRRQ
jgi:hypothetical protein